MIRRLGAVLLAVLLCGCSATEFAYNHADTWLRWQGGRYVELDGAQAEEFDRRLEAFLAWHRAQALPQYARLAAEAGARLERGAARADLVWGYDAIWQQSRQGLRRAGAELGDFADRLTPAQIGQIERRFAKLNRSYVREWVEAAPGELRDRRAKRMVRTLEQWLGELSDAQRERVRQFNESVPLNGELRDRERRRLQAELLAMLRARQAAARLPDWAAQWDRGREPEFAAASGAYMVGFFDMLAQLEASLSARQRLHAVARLRGYARDFGHLAAAP